MTPTISASNSIKDAPELNANKAPHVQGVILTPTIYESNSYVDTQALNSNDSTFQLPNSINLPCVSDNSKSQNPNN